MTKFGTVTQIGPLQGTVKISNFSKTKMAAEGRHREKSQKNAISQQRIDRFPRILARLCKMGLLIVQRPDLQNILRFIVRLSQVYRKIDLR